MGQNNDNTEHGDLQGQQGGNLSRDPKKHERLRQPEEGFARFGEEQSEPPIPGPQTNSGEKADRSRVYRR